MTQPLSGLIHATDAVQATFCGGAAFSCLPWTRSNNTIWVAEALWFGSLVCSMFAIITSIQTKSILDDLPSSEELNVTSLPNIEVRRMQRTILRYRNTPGIKHWVMIFIWQFPSMTMAYAWCTFIMGLTVYTCSPFIQRLPWENRHKVELPYLQMLPYANVDKDRHSLPRIQSRGPGHLHLCYDICLRGRERL
jgi:hypothetical protein